LRALRQRTLADEYAAATEAMAALQDGQALRAAAASLAPRLPTGRLALVSTSSQGAALAAVCAATRAEPTSWQLFNLAYPPQARTGEQAVLVEPVDPGHGWEAAVRRRFGEVEVLFASSTELAAQAA